MPPIALKGSNIGYCAFDDRHYFLLSWGIDESLETDCKRAKQMPTWEDVQSYLVVRQYDPTNGTASLGDMIVFATAQ